MSEKKTLTLAIMDAPYESARSTTALRILNVAARRGYDINVFAFEGAVAQPFNRRAAHPSAVEGIRRGTPGDFWKMASASDNTLVIPTQ